MTSPSPDHPRHEAAGPIPADLAARVKAHHDELVALRRDLHAHPELSWAEVRTTGLVRDRLQQAGLASRVLAGGTGLVCDIGSGDRVVGLRADIDALPIVDLKTAPYASTVPGACHACGHDVHTAAVLGAGLVLAELARGGSAARGGPADLPARRGVLPQRRARRPRGRRRRPAWSGSSPCTATRAPTSGGSGCAAVPSRGPPTSSRCACTARAVTPRDRT